MRRGSGDSGGGRGPCGGESGRGCRSWPGKEGDNSGDGVRGVKGVSGSESEDDGDGCGDIGGRGIDSSGLDGSEGGWSVRNVGDEGRFSFAGSVIGSGIDVGDAWVVAVLCGLWHESEGFRGRACPFDV